MLIYLLGIIYTTFICWGWGLGAWILLQKQVGKGNASQLTLPEQSLLGMILIIITGTLLNFWIPLNGWIQQFTLLFIAIAFFLKYAGYRSIKSEWSYLRLLPLTSKLILGLALSVILIMSSWSILHPDSLGYHFPLIRWAAEHKVTPGLANLHIRFGYQSNWFVGAAIFDTGFLGLQGLSPLNGSMLLWLVAFCIRKINTYQLYDENKGRKFYWLLLVFMMGWSYTQFRLTATSASADFITTILIWYIFYLAINLSKEPLYRMLLIILISFSFTIKLSSAPLGLLLIYLLFENKLEFLRKYFLQLVICMTIIVVPFLVRNHISSGYLLFPVSWASVGAPDWKAKVGEVEKEAAYVKAYARMQAERDMNSISSATNAGLQEWMPVWIQQRSEADLTILLFALLLLVVGVLHHKFIWRGSVAFKLTLGTAIVGVFFWFYNAPDPRFGWGYIIGLTAMILYQLPTPAFLQKNEKLFLSTTSWILLSFGTAYFVYRAYNYSTPYTWIKPAGVIPQKGSVLRIGGIDLFLPKPGNNCGNTSLPCTYDSVSLVEPRGQFPENGFRPRASR